MPYNEALANRVRELIAAREDNVEEKRMFGGLAFLVNTKICVAVKSDKILVRIDPNLFEKEVQGLGCTPMRMSSRESKSFLFVDEDVLDTHSKLKRWVDLALEYNPRANATPREKKK